MRLQILVSALLATFSINDVQGSPAPNPTLDKRFWGDPVVTQSIPVATIRGRSEPYLDSRPLAAGVLESFRGIPYAQAPVFNLRLRQPQPLDPNKNLGNIDATTKFPNSCPQQIQNAQLDIPNVPKIVEDVIEAAFNSPVVDNKVVGGTEDCLTLNVQRPGNINPGANLPVLIWFYGGGFEVGSTLMYDGGNVVQRSIEVGKPVIFVTMNFRAAGFGFLGGREILGDGSANIGLNDQRMAMQWVADNIRQFGGDPDRVTLWGESSGAISVFNQMLAFGGNNLYRGRPLFRAAIMSSGSAVPADAVDSAKPQAIYNQVVANAGCGGRPDSLQCLREVPYETFLSATNSVPFILSYRSLALSYLPRPDGRFLPQSPEQAGRAGLYAKVPYIIGDQQDEGTLFALFTSNITNTAQLESYLQQFYFSNPNAQVQRLVSLYPDDPSAGSPYNTGNENNIYPQYKRVASILGDLIFTLTRRAVLNITSQVAQNVPSWSYISTYDQGTPILGTLHGSDILQTFYGVKDNYAAAATLTYFLNFAYNLDPNNGAGGPGRGRPPQLINWPQWSQGRQLVNFGANSFSLTPDNFRQQAFDFILGNVQNLRF